jgi:CheY-like chemotaxis protein
MATMLCVGMDDAPTLSALDGRFSLTHARTESAALALIAQAGAQLPDVVLLCIYLDEADEKAIFSTLRTAARIRATSHACGPVRIIVAVCGAAAAAAAAAVVATLAAVTDDARAAASADGSTPDASVAPPLPSVAANAAVSDAAAATLEIVPLVVPLVASALGSLAGETEQLLTGAALPLVAVVMAAAPVLATSAAAAAVASTAASSDAVVAAAMAAGANACVLVALQRAELPDLVDSVLRTAALERDAQANLLLLERMLPPPVISRLKHGQKFIAESMESVSILFCDVCCFTDLAALVSTTQILVLLNELFSAFDALMDQHGCYKVSVAALTAFVLR